jgi:hypothetical protein
LLLFFRYNPTPDDYKEVDADEQARIQRALEIQTGIEIDRTSTASLHEDLTRSTVSPLLVVRSEDVVGTKNATDSCVRCQQHQHKQFGLAQTTLFPLNDGEMPRIHSQDYYCHFLVPDLQKITACCYYWGMLLTCISTHLHHTRF